MLKVDKTWLPISCSYVFLIKVTFVYIISVIMDDEKAREPVYYLESSSWPGMCISIEFSFIK